MAERAAIRSGVWHKLRPYALPDSRFHLDLSSHIPDFEGSAAATARLADQPVFQRARYAFITPDNCLTDLRRLMLETGRTIVVSTYGIHRGFILLEPARIPPGLALYAAWLDGLEHFGRRVTLDELARRGRFDLLVTGASAVSRNGVRFGKGHGFFDLEWGMFTELGIVDETTPVAAVVHDVQVVEEVLTPGPTDIRVDFIVTPTKWEQVDRGPRPFGIHWSRLEPHQLRETPPLRELQLRLGLEVTKAENDSS